MGAHEQGRRPAGRDLTDDRTADVCLIDAGLSHLARSFTYLAPPAVGVAIGSVVRVPFRGRNRTGVVIALDTPPVANALPIKECLGPGIEPETVALASWTAERYLSTLGEALAAAVPARVAAEEEREASPHGTEAPPADLSWLADLTRGGTLVRAVTTGRGGGFVLRPRADVPRGPSICSLVGAALQRGRGALVLVSEVRAGAGVVKALRATFGDEVAWLGSDRASRARYRAWLDLRTGAARIAVGGRGAVFAPVRRLGLIVIDDESHAAYKEGRAPRFHARTVAAERARRAKVPIVLVGVPPSIEARAAADGAGYTFVAPRRSAERTARPPVTVVERGPGERLVPTAATLRLAARTLSSDRRVLLLVHRGGDALARAAERAVRILQPPSHALVTADTPAADVKRARAAALVVATPAVVKDVPMARLGAMIVAEADAALTRPSFRAPEEVFATWWRTAPWIAGGHVAIETTDPAQPAIAALERWDPELLYAAEAERRRELRYPPYAVVARIDVPAARGEEVAEQVRAAGAGLEVLGPVVDGDAAVLVVRAERRATLLQGIGPLVERWRADDEPMRVDVDPWEVLVPKWRS